MINMAFLPLQVKTPRFSTKPLEQKQKHPQQQTLLKQQMHFQKRAKKPICNSDRADEQQNLALSCQIMSHNNVLHSGQEKSNAATT